MTLFNIIKDIQDINRFREILAVVIEEGMGYLLTKAKLYRFVPLTKRFKAKLRKKHATTNPVRLRLALERLGPTFIKLGQMLSVRPDIIPLAYLKELEKMQDSVPPFTFKEVKEIIKFELKQPINKIFKSFDRKPIASASIGQVHKAILKNGKKVAVKVQRPNIKKNINIDINIMYHIAKKLEKHHPKLRKYHLVAIVKEFEKWTLNELDYRKEAANAEIFRKNFKNKKNIIIPTIYWDYTTNKILTMQFINGIELHDIKEIKRKKINIKKILNTGFEAILMQAFVHGFFHADPHPGNLFIVGKNKLAFVDFGIVGYFDENMKKKMHSTFFSFINDDVEGLVKTLLSLGVVDNKTVDVEAFKADIQRLIEPIQHTSFKELRISLLLEQVLNLALDYNIKMQRDFVLFGKMVATLEGVAMEYEPDFNLVKSSKPLLKKLVLKRTFNAKRMAKDAITYADFLSQLPKQAADALNKIKEGKIDIEIEHKELESFEKQIERSSGNLSLALVTAAFIVGAALVMQANVGPFILDYPVLSLVGIIMACTFGLVLLYRLIFPKIRGD